jgi:hypothetical protein
LERSNVDGIAEYFTSLFLSLDFTANRIYCPAISAVCWLDLVNCLAVCSNGEAVESGRVAIAPNAKSDVIVCWGMSLLSRGISGH